MFIQAEDELAAVSIAIGAAYSGHLAITGSSGPGLSLKSEAIGYACMAEIPLIVVNVQRGGPSTGLPTSVEQSDLMQAIYKDDTDSDPTTYARSVLIILESLTVLATLLFLFPTLHPYRRFGRRYIRLTHSDIIASGALTVIATILLVLYW